MSPAIRPRRDAGTRQGSSFWIWLPPQEERPLAALSGEFTARAVGRPECDAAMPVSKKVV